MGFLFLLLVLIPVVMLALFVTLWTRVNTLIAAGEQTSAQLKLEAERREIFSRRLVELQRQVTNLTGTTPAPGAPQPAPAATTPPPAVAVAETAKPVPAPAPAIPKAPTPVMPPTSPREVFTESRPTASHRLEEMASSTGGWEQLIGGNLLNKVGALVLVIGMALFLSYSFSNMGPSGRAFTGLGISVGMLIAGAAFERRDRYRVFSRGIMAAGWAALYFTSYAMYALPAAQVIDSPALGTALMVAVAAGMVTHSLRYRVQSLTALAFGCIFAALALSTLTTFTAIALIPLAASALYLARRFDWHGLAVFSAAATYAVFLTRPDTGAPLINIQSMLLLYWVMFEAFDILRLRKGRDASSGFGHALFGVNALAGLGASAAVWYKLAPDSMWIFCAGAATLYMISTWVRFALEGETLYEFTLTISAVLTAFAIVARADGLWRSFGIILEAELLFLAGHYLRVRFAKILSLIGFVAAIRIAIDAGMNTHVALLTGGVVYTWTPALALIAAVFYINWYLSKEENYFGYVASGLVVVVLGAELPLRFIGFGLVLLTAVLFELGLRKNLRDLRYQSYVIGALSLAGAMTRFSDPVAVPFAWTDAAGAVFFLSLALRATRLLPSLSDSETFVMRLGGSCGTAFLGSLFVAHVVPAPYEGLGLLALSAILAELALRRMPGEMAWPAVVLNAAALVRIAVDHAGAIHKFPDASTSITIAGAACIYYWLTARLFHCKDPLTYSAAAAVGNKLALLALWMVLPDLWVPIVFAALALLVTEAGLVLSTPELIWQGRVISVIAALALPFNVADTVTGRVLASSAVAASHFLLRYRTRRELHAFAHGSLAAFIVATLLFNEVSGGMLTLSWSMEGIALLAAGFLTRDRTLRLAGLGGLLICIVKVFFHDLSALETVYRILSFIGLGVILLTVSFIYTRFKEQIQKFL